MPQPLSQRLIDIQVLIEQSQGLIFGGEITAIAAGVSLTIDSLIGKVDNIFVPASGDAYQILIAAADGAAPEGEMQVATGYTTASGLFAYGGAFTAEPAIGDYVLLIHPMIASLGTISSAAAIGAVTNTDTMMAYIKQLVTNSETEIADSGLSYMGTITGVAAGASLTIDSLKDMGTNFFFPTDGPAWTIWIVEADGAAPSGERQLCTGYTTASGLFAYGGAFSAEPSIGDQIILIHPLIASIGTMIDTISAGIINDTDTMASNIKKISTLGPTVILADITTAANVTSFACESLIGWEDEFFLNWSAYLVRDDGGAGAAPQGEWRKISAYVSATGTFTILAFSAAHIVGDQVMLVHPMMPDMLAMRGGAATIQSNSVKLDDIFELIHVTGSVTLTNAVETNLFELDGSFGKPQRVDTLWIDFTGLNNGAGENTTIKVYKKMASGGAYVKIWESTAAYLIAALPDPLGVQIPNDDNGDILSLPITHRYGYLITVTQAAIGGGWNTIPYEVSYAT